MVGKMEVTQEDWKQLCRLNPVAEAQMEAITALRMCREKDATIKSLKDQLALVKELGC